MRTIPEASNDEFRGAFNGIRETAKRMGIDANDPIMSEFILHMSEVKAQLIAENRWLSNMLHPKDLPPIK